MRRQTDGYSTVQTSVSSLSPPPIPIRIHLNTRCDLHFIFISGMLKGKSFEMLSHFYDTKPLLNLSTSLTLHDLGR